MPGDMNIRDLRQILMTALEAGCERISAMRFKWDISGDCENPHTQELFARPEAKIGRKFIGVEPGTEHPLELELLTRCRSCESCLWQRRNLWTARAVEECRAASRTWFATFTVAPEHRCAFEYRMHMRLGERSVQTADLSAEELFREKAKEVLQEAQKWIKRQRVRFAPRRFRYIMVVEKHKDGDPHLHALLHEVNAPVRHWEWEFLDEAKTKPTWSFGFVKFRLVESVDGENAGKTAYYVCKYLGKDMLARVRASLSYGQRTFTVFPLGKTSTISDASVPKEQRDGYSWNKADPQPKNFVFDAKFTSLKKNDGETVLPVNGTGL